MDFLPTARNEKGQNLYRAELSLQRADARLRPGMACRVTVVLDEVRNAVLIPKRAIRHGKEGATVRCALENGRRQDRSVILGPEDGENVVVEKGLNEGDRVVIANEDGR